MDISIGGYSLQSYENKGLDGYKAVLAKDGKNLVYVDNLGEGYMHVDFEPLPEGQSLKYYNFILYDLTTLLVELDSILEPEAVYRRFLRSKYSAALGFIELLKDLKGLVDIYHSVPVKTFSGYYIIGAYGKSFFTKKSKNKPRKYFWKDPLTHYFLEARKTAEANAKRSYVLDGDLVALAILQGDMDWNLTFEQYGQLYKP